MKKRIAVLLLALLILAALLAGCSAEAQDSSNVLTLNMSNAGIDLFLDAMQAEFPDIEFQIYRYFGENGTSFLRETYLNDDVSDIAYYTMLLEPEIAGSALLDMSGYQFINKIDMATLNQYDDDGHIYQIPGPVSVRCMAYNKTMFDEHGWEEPDSFDALLTLVERIRAEEPDIIPLTMSLGGVGYPFTMVTTFSQAGFLATPAGAEWEQEYLRGNASIEEGWGEGLEMAARLIDAGAFKDIENNIGVWDSAVLEEVFGAGKAAMAFVWGGQSNLLTLMGKSDYEIELMPIPGHDRGEAIIGASSGCNFGISKKLAEKGNEKKLENALKVMEWITTPEAQGYLMQNSAEVPSLMEADAEKIHPQYLSLWNKAKNVVKAPMIYAGYEDILVDAGTLLQEYMVSGSSEGMIESFVRLVDEEHAAALFDYLPKPSYGEAAEDIDNEHLVQLVADIMYSSKLADFALVSIGGHDGKCKNEQGVYGWMYKGTIDSTNYTVMCPSSGNKPLQVLTLSGAQIKQLLETGKPSLYREKVSYYGRLWDYYWSGIDVEMKDGKVIEVFLNGTPMSDEGEYRVLFTNRDYPETLVSADKIEDCELSTSNLIREYIENNSPVCAPKTLCR